MSSRAKSEIPKANASWVLVVQNNLLTTKDTKKHISGDGIHVSSLEKKSFESHMDFTGRIDDIMNVAGHRNSTNEMENVFGKHPNCPEVEVLGQQIEILVLSISRFITLKNIWIESSRKAETRWWYVASSPRKNLAKYLEEFCDGW